MFYGGRPRRRESGGDWKGGEEGEGGGGVVEGGEGGEGAVCEVVIWRVFIPFFRVWDYIIGVDCVLLYV